MKIAVYDRHDQFDSVALTKNALGLSLLVNTRERWPEFSHRGYCVEAGQEYPDHSAFSIATQFDAEDNPTNQSWLVLVPENEEDKKLLSGIKYFETNKDQICVQFIDQALLFDKEHITEWVKPKSKPAP